MKHIIALLIENEPGALSRVVALFSARGYNIESLTVAPTEDPSLSRMTIVTAGSDEVIEQITKHLNRLGSSSAAGLGARGNAHPNPRLQALTDLPTPAAFPKCPCPP